MARPLEFDRSEAVARAQALFLRNGYEATSIDDLTQALGISRASLYNSFGDKRSLMIEALSAAEDDGEQMREAACGRRCGAKKIVRDIFEKLVDANMQKADGRGCFLLTLGAELASGDEEVKRRVAVSLEASRLMFAEILAREENLTRRQIEAKSAGLLGTMVSLLMLVRVHPDKKLLGDLITQGLSILD